MTDEAAKTVSVWRLDPATGDTIATLEWTRAFGEDVELQRPPRQVAVADGRIAFWADLDGPVISALDLDAGDIEWTAKPSSFDNAIGQISGVGGLGFLISPFGGAWLEALVDDEQLWAIDEVPSLESLQTRTPVDIGLLVSGNVPRQEANGVCVGVVDLDHWPATVTP